MDNISVVAIIYSLLTNLLSGPLCFGVERHCLKPGESGSHRLEPFVNRLEPLVNRLESSVHVLALFDKLLVDRLESSVHVLALSD